jgi:hypothetical protein
MENYDNTPKTIVIGVFNGYSANFYFAGTEFSFGIIAGDASEDSEFPSLWPLE